MGHLQPCRLSFNRRKRCRTEILVWNGQSLLMSESLESRKEMDKMR